MFPGKVRRLLACVFIACATFVHAVTAKPLVVGYIFPQSTLLADTHIDLRGLTCVNYAFAGIRHGRLVQGNPDDARNLAWLVAQRVHNPSLEILISVGGWKGSGGFSGVAHSSRSRRKFINSVMQFLHRYGLNGLDVDWEYPGLPGAGHPFRRADKKNFTLLLQELHQRFEHESQKAHKHYILTIAAGASQEFLDHTEMAKVQQYVDRVNLMSYDYNQSGADATTGHNAPLFTNPQAPKGESADASVAAFEQEGVPASKIVLGVPFYGRMWGDVPDKAHGLFQHGAPAEMSYVPYRIIADTWIRALLGQERISSLSLQRRETHFRLL